MQWRRGADAPVKFRAAQAVVMGESVYVGGGGGTGHVILQFIRNMGAWNKLPECPVRYFGLTQITGRLTTVGGVDRAESITGCVYEFVSESQQWQELLPPMPTARYDVAIVSRPSSSPKPSDIVVCGGVGVGKVSINTVEIFCHSTSQWHMAEPLPTPLCGLTSAIIGDIVYLLGGRNSGANGTGHCFCASLDSLINKATFIGSVQYQHGSIWMAVCGTVLSDSCAASLGGSLLAIGGKDGRGSSAAIHLFTNSGSWERVKGGDMPEPRFCSTAVYMASDELMVVGGGSTGLFNVDTCTFFHGFFRIVN